MKANSFLPCVCRTYFHRLLCSKILGRKEIPFRSKLGGCKWIFPLICNQGGKQIHPAVLISPRKYGHPSSQYWLSRYLGAKKTPAARVRSRQSPSSVRSRGQQQGGSKSFAWSLLHPVCSTPSL